MAQEVERTVVQFTAPANSKSKGPLARYWASICSHWLFHRCMNGAYERLLLPMSRWCLTWWPLQPVYESVVCVCVVCTVDSEISLKHSRRYDSTSVIMMVLGGLNVFWGGARWKTLERYCDTAFQGWRQCWNDPSAQCSEHFFDSII